MSSGYDFRVFSNRHVCVDLQNISMASNEVNMENNNASGSEDTYTDTNVTLNPMVLLVRVEHVDGRPIESKVLTEAAFKELHIHHMQLRSLVCMKFVLPTNKG